MPIEVEAPDGTVVEFPAATPAEIIRRVMARAFAPQQAAPETIAQGAR
jgi:hypothetical protein